jgi:hypothetical protein
MAGTRVLRIALKEAAAKMRAGGVMDADDDLSIPVWAGVLPLHTQVGRPEPDTSCAVVESPAVPGFLSS